MPMPNQGESASSFLQRCMADPEAQRTAPDTQQRVALCHGLWDQHQQNMPKDMPGKP
jgi:hypothetical protein